MKRLATLGHCGALAIALGVLASPALGFAQIPGGSLHPSSIEKYVDPLVIPPAMPRTTKLKQTMGKNIDSYEIAVRQFQQQILPSTLTSCGENNDQPCLTTVWGYGSVNHPGTFNYPAFTIEAKHRTPLRVKWINELVDADGNYLPHLLPVDQTLHWANPAGGCLMDGVSSDCRTDNPDSYRGPVPMVVHVHGADTYEWADGYPEAWYLPAASNLPSTYATGGSFFGTFAGAASTTTGAWPTGSAIFEYPNDQPATTLWYHDHSLGMTRQNVYAGPAGFYILRGGPGDEVTSKVKNGLAVLPGPAPALGDPPGLTYYELPIVIQDRSFNEDGSLFYPDNRAFFEGLEPSQLKIPFIPQLTRDGEKSDVSPLWNPEFFGNVMVTNGRSWPVLDVETRRYRLRFLNGCNSRFLILRMVTATDPDDSTTWKQVPGAFWQIGAEQGFLPAAVQLDELLMGPAERADTIIDFGAIQVPTGEGLYLVNVAPDEPFGGGVPCTGDAEGCDFDPAHPGSTGQVMKFVLVPTKGRDNTTPPTQLVFPAPAYPPSAVAEIRRITLNEEESQTVFVVEDEDGNLVEVAETDEDAARFGPTEALLGTLNPDGTSTALGWAAATTENVASNDSEEWEIYNFTMDAHPIHIHLVQFQVVNRQPLLTNEEGMAVQPATVAGTARGPEMWEAGLKDTVIAYPGEVTRVRAQFRREGLFVWHCHILEHEDNEMMRPYCVGNSAACDQHNERAEGMMH